MMSTNYCFHFEYLSYCLFIGILLDLFTLIIELVDLSVRFYCHLFSFYRLFSIGQRRVFLDLLCLSIVLGGLMGSQR